MKAHQTPANPLTFSRLALLTRAMCSTSSLTSSQPAPWKKTFLEHVCRMPSPEFVLSTLALAPTGSPTTYVPRARYCIFRGMWAELPENQHNKAPKNPKVYESELPTFTTDLRMEKIGQIFGPSADEEQRRGSGGGGPVEAVFLMKDEGVMTQWRIKGTAFVVAPDIDNAAHSGVQSVKSEIGKRMSVVDASRVGEWSWEREMLRHFGNVSPGIRGSWKQPPPGRPVSVNPDPQNLKMGDTVEDLDDPVSRSNFRVVIVKPDSVEATDLSDPSKARRQRYTYEERSGQWKHEELWP